MPPGRNDDRIARTCADIYKKLGDADDANVQQSPGQTAHRVAAIVLGYAEQLSAALLRSKDPVAGAHGQAQWFFDQNMQAQVKGFTDHAVMGGCIGGNVDCLKVGHGLSHFG